MKYLKYLILILLVSFSFTSLKAREKAIGDWSDLTAGERKYYGSEKEEKKATYAFFIEKENWEDHYNLMLFWLFKYTDFPKYNLVRAWPLYYHQESKIDNRKRSWGLGWPLLFYYHSIDGPEELTVHIPVYFSNLKENGSKRSLFYFIWWGNEKDEHSGYNRSFFNIYPFYFYKSGYNDNKTSENFRLTLFPLIYWSFSTSKYANYATEERRNFSLLHYYHSFSRENKQEGSGSGTTWWFPIIPLTYNHTYRRGGHRNLFWLIDYSWISAGEGDRLKRLWIIPLFFIKRGEKGYTHIFPPLFMSFRNYTGGYSHLLPLYFSWKGRDTVYDYRSKKNIYRNYDSFLSIFYSRFIKYNTDNSGNKESLSDTLWFGPFFPLIYYSSEDRTGIHKNVFWLIDWKRNINNEMKRFWLIPLWFHSFGEGGYNHILPPLYMSFRQEDGDYYRHLLPLFFSWKKSMNSFTGKDNTGIKTHYEYHYFVSILFSRFTREKRTGESDPEIYYDTIWFGPFIPLIFNSSTNDDGIHWNILWFLDWKSDPHGRLERFWLIPFVFYKSGTGGYRHFFPFYLRSSGWSPAEGSSLGIFHYHKWSVSENKIWIWPFYADYNLEEKTYFSFFIPIGVTWKSKRSSGDIFLPVLFNYRSKKRSYHINILGLSKTAVMGPASPEVSLDIGKYKGNWFLDTDISWLYDVFSFSTRITLKNPWKKNSNLTVSQISENEKVLKSFSAGDENEFSGSSPRISKKTDDEFSRENSEYFWGWRVLFGLWSYEKADTWRRIRVLPLLWLSWDNASEDQVTIFPPILPLYVNYKSRKDQTEYFLILPFYGVQRVKKSYSKGYFLIAYWDQYDDETKQEEKTILWPLINWYSSPVKSGWRIFPLVWRKHERDKGILTSKIITPLHYSHYKTNEKENITLYKFVINPFYFSQKKVDQGTITGRTFAPLLPLYYSSSSHTIRRIENEPGMIRNGSTAEEKWEGMSFLVPFYWTAKSGERIKNGRESETFRLIVPLSLLFYKSRVYSSEAKNGEQFSGRMTGFKDYSLFIFGFHFYREKYEWGNSFLWGLLWDYRSDTRTDFSRLNFIFGLLSFRSSGKTSKTWFFPFYYKSSTPDTEEFSLLLGLYKSYNSNIEERSYRKCFWGLFWYSSFSDTEQSALTSYRTIKTERKRNWLIPFYYYTESRGEGGYKRARHFSLLHYRSRESIINGNSEKYSSTIWIPLLPLFYWNRSRNSHTDETTHWNLLGLIDRKSSADNSYNRSFFLPFFYTSSGTYGTRDGRFYFFALPVLFSGYSESPGSKSLMILGTYWHRSQTYERQNFYYLYDHRRYHRTGNSDGKDIYNYLFTTIRYEISPQLKKFRMFWGALLSYRGYSGSDRYEISILFNIINRERGRDFSYSHFFPLFYYKNYYDPSRGWYLLSPVALSYFSSDSTGDFDLGLLGIIYYRNNEIQEQKDKRMWLGGSLWYEVRRPERGYHSRGMLWGLLWDYETESETGFKKFSILKGLYKRVDYQGETRHKFFWIF